MRPDFFFFDMIKDQYILYRNPTKIGFFMVEIKPIQKNFSPFSSNFLALFWTYRDWSVGEMKFGTEM